MSRIERALEKALKMRTSTTTPSRSAFWPTTYSKCDPSVFEVTEGGVDPAAVDRHIVSITDPFSSAAEEFRKLRARIFQVTEKDFLNTLMVTSGQAGEGKTTTAINLAVAIANEIDHTVLLIDADLRKPSIHRYLGLNPPYGLSDYLDSRRNLSLPDIMIKTGIGKLVLLPAGNTPENPAELISSDRMRQLIREIKHRYRDRYVIFDSSPLLMTADALSLCDYMDAIIFVVQAARTPKKAAAQALSLVRGYNVLGTVFNDVPTYLAKNLYPYYYRTESAGTLKALEDHSRSGGTKQISDNTGDGNSVKTLNEADGGNNGGNPENR
jgi:protein-tyrosine kinase